VDARPAEEDLLAPSLQAEEPVRALVPGERPWRIGSQVYVGFFGGALAVAAIAFANARRLRAARRTERGIVVIGVVGVAVSIVAGYIANEASDGNGTAHRLASRIVGVVVAGVLYKLLKPADRIYSFRSPAEADDDYDSLWGPGIVAVLAGGIVQEVLVRGGIVAIDAVVG
jgi:hypothetical protein